MKISNYVNKYQTHSIYIYLVGLEKRRYYNHPLVLFATESQDVIRITSSLDVITFLLLAWLVGIFLKFTLRLLSERLFDLNQLETLFCTILACWTGVSLAGSIVQLRASGTGYSESVVILG